MALYILAFCRIVIGFVFALSFGGKILSLSRFIHTVQEFAILPGKLSAPAAFLFLCTEGAVVILLLVGGILLPTAFLLAACLLMLFSAALISVLVRRLRTSCNCFGASEKLVSPADVWRNLGLIVCTLVGYGLLAWLQVHSEPAGLGFSDWLLAGLGALVFVLIWLQLDELMQLFRQN